MSPWFGLGHDVLFIFRSVYERADKSLKNAEEKEERVMLLEAWKEYEVFYDEFIVWAENSLENSTCSLNAWNARETLPRMSRVLPSFVCSFFLSFFKSSYLLLLHLLCRMNTVTTAHKKKLRKRCLDVSRREEKCKRTTGWVFYSSLVTQPLLSRRNKALRDKPSYIGSSRSQAKLIIHRIWKKP